MELRSRCLKFYKQKWVMEAISDLAQEKEVAFRYGDGFGNRPDMISYADDAVIKDKAVCCPDCNNCMGLG